VWRSPAAPPFTAEEARTVPLVADQISIALGNVLAGHSLDLTLRELRELSLQAVGSLVRAVEMRDRYTAGHSVRVSRYAVALARTLGVDEGDIETLRVAALLHDVGKIGISDLLLNKPGPLTPAERQQIEEHPAMGCQIIAGVQSLTPVLPLILHHQEHYDGLGYPQRLAREQIPYGARILAVADSFEAMTATRAYREGRSVAEALRILSAGAGQQWDPVMVAAWQQIVARLLSSTH
jgi:putative nucleotidyltransferase with HDIG domain